MTNRDKFVIKECGCLYDPATDITLHFCDKHDPAHFYHDVEEANLTITILSRQKTAWVVIAKDVAKHCRHKAEGQCIGCRGLAVCDVKGLEFITLPEVTVILSKTALAMIMEERKRQQVEEGYSLKHDDEHNEGQLALLAAAYALSSREKSPQVETMDPHSETYVPSHGLEYVVGLVESYGWEFNPKTAVDDLVRSGALILAELERLLRNS